MNERLKNMQCCQPNKIKLRYQQLLLVACHYVFNHGNVNFTKNKINCLHFYNINFKINSVSTHEFPF